MNDNVPFSPPTALDNVTGRGRSRPGAAAKAMLLPFALSFVLVIVTKWMPPIDRGTVDSP